MNAIRANRWQILFKPKSIWKSLEKLLENTVPEEIHSRIIKKKICLDETFSIRNPYWKSSENYLGNIVQEKNPYEIHENAAGDYFSGGGGEINWITISKTLAHYIFQWEIHLKIIEKLLETIFATEKFVENPAEGNWKTFFM